MSVATFFACKVLLDVSDRVNFEGLSGNDLLEIALDKVYSIKDMAGGMITFLEAENNEKLINFY